MTKQSKLFNKLMKAGMSKEDIWVLKAEKILENTYTGEDLTKLGHHINEAIDKNYNLNVFDYQILAAKKLREVYGRVGL